MNDLQVCLIITREHPETVGFDHVLLTRGGVEEEGLPMEIVEARETQRLTKFTGSLDILQFNPKDSDGKANCRVWICSITCVIFGMFAQPRGQQ